MSRYYTKEDLKLEEFYKMPKILFSGKYKNMSNNSRVLFTLLKDRFNLSLKNNWHDEKGIYLIFSREEMTEILNLSKDTVKKIVDELKNLELIEEKRQGLNKPNKIYVLKPKVETQNTTSFETENLGISNDKNKCSHNNKTNITKTNSSKTKNNNIQFLSEIETKIFSFEDYEHIIEQAYLKFEDIAENEDRTVFLDLDEIKSLYNAFYSLLIQYDYPLPKITINSVLKALKSYNDISYVEVENYIEPYMQDNFRKGTNRTINHFLSNGIIAMYDIRENGSSSLFYDEYKK